MKCHDCQHQEPRYNGWTNYETWCVKLWIDNGQASHETALRIARDARSSEANTEGRTATGYAADALRDWIEYETYPEDMVPGIASDLLRAALSEVDWYEIAEAYLEDLED